MNEFGGEWTSKKLEVLRKYLQAYRTIFDKNPGASHFNTVYIDGFAGSGKWAARKKNTGSDASLFENPEEENEAAEFSEGSVPIALGLDSPFDRYVFIEIARPIAGELDRLLGERYQHMRERAEILIGDCNEKLCEITDNWDSRKDRGVCFLDPYGMSVNWATIESIARTKAIDLWLMVPLGTGICRLLKRKEIPDGSWADRLDQAFGTREWRDDFYNTEKKQDLFGELYETERCVGPEEIGEYFLERLRTVFAGVAEKPLFLRNSKNNPLFLLCFAAGNERGCSTAVKIACEIMGRI